MCANVLEKFYFETYTLFDFFYSGKKITLLQPLKANHSPRKNRVFLGMGSNIGDRRAQLDHARTAINSKIGKIVNASSIYETAPWGHTEQPHFYNQVLMVETTLSAGQVMDKILLIEKSMGRRRTFLYAPREIDIDILFFDNEIISGNGLVIPHPHLEERNFVLAPLKEIAPNMVHPVLQKKISTIAAECKDLLDVKRIMD